VSFDERELIEYVTQQRWYGAKSRSVAHSQILDAVVLRTTDPQLALALAEIRYDTGAHDIYQLLYSTRDGVSEFDGLGDPQLARELVSALRSGLTVQGAEGTVEFAPVEGFAGLGRELREVRAVGAEQSNSSVVFDDELILKVFRRLEPGINPELEMLRFLTEHEFENIPPLGGWYAYSGGPLGATLGILQQYVGGVDGWDLALDEIAERPDHFLRRLHRLGEVTGEMHTVLGSDANEPAFAPETPSVESLGLLTATVDEEIERVFVALPEDDERIRPILGRGEEVREQLRLLTHAGATGKVIRTHGDYHLGQTLWVSGLETPSAEPKAPGRRPRPPAASDWGDWVVLDFEGEPARSVAERRRKRSPLRDVAGMLRSFAYAASAAELLRGMPAPEGWEQQARLVFLEGYVETVDPALLPSGQVSIDRLLSVFELEKAVYELRYELDNRPDWVGIPVAGIQRLIEQAAAAS
jgi:predicted trehalose synthase